MMSFHQRYGKQNEESKKRSKSVHSPSPTKNQIINNDLQESPPLKPSVPRTSTLVSGIKLKPKELGLGTIQKALSKEEEEFKQKLIRAGQIAKEREEIRSRNNISLHSKSSYHESPVKNPIPWGANPET